MNQEWEREKYMARKRMRGRQGEGKSEREGKRDGEKYVGRERESHRADRERVRERWTERNKNKS